MYQSNFSCFKINFFVTETEGNKDVINVSLMKSRLDAVENGLNGLDNKLTCQNQIIDKLETTMKKLYILIHKQMGIKEEVGEEK